MAYFLRDPYKAKGIDLQHLLALTRREDAASGYRSKLHRGQDRR
jgi:hypothetical protein